MQSNRQHISVVVPVCNEGVNVLLLQKALQEAAQSQPYVFDFIFVNDGSTDTSASVLEALERKDSRVHVLTFSRNFGKEAAVSAGLHAAKGDAVIIMDADLQHPPELIGAFIQKWEQGAEVVIGVRQYSQKESLLKRYTSDTYYALMRSVVHAQITPHASDFRLLDRSVVEAFNELTERNRMTRGIIDWLGFEREYVPFVAPPRTHGNASYTYKKLMELALNSVTSYSMLPLKLAGYVGVLILLVSAPAGIFVFIEKYIMHDPFHLRITGTAVLALLLLFLVGIVLACLGLIALYIAQIHVEVTNRPLYILRKNNPKRARSGEQNKQETEPDSTDRERASEPVNNLEDLERV